MATFVDRRDGGDLVLRVGEKRAIEHKVTIDNDAMFTVGSAPVCTLYNSAGATVVNGAAASVDTTAAASEHAITYLWETSGQTAGDYRYNLQLNAADQVLLLHGDLTLVPVVSKLDRWVRRIRDLILESPNKDAALGISEAQYRKAAANAVRALSQAHPREQISSVSLAGTFEYDLPPDWVGNFSRLVRVEYPVDDTDQPRDWLDPDEYDWDDLRNKWRFTSIVPGTSETARLYYTSQHSVTDTADTTSGDVIADRHFDAAVMWAAGECLMALANRAAGTQASDGAAEVVNYRTKQQEYRQQGLEWQRLAVQSWGGRVNAGVMPTPF